MLVRTHTFVLILPVIPWCLQYPAQGQTHHKGFIIPQSCQNSEEDKDIKGHLVQPQDFRDEINED